MADLILRCKDKRYPRSDWLLALTATGGQLTDAQQVQHAAFSHAEAEKRFIFPSFWQSIKDLGVVSDAGDTIWFVADSTAIAKIRGYLGIALATQGPAAIQAVKTKAWLQVLGGIVLLLVAIGGSVLTLLQALARPEGGRYFMLFGVLAVGGFLLARGLASLSTVAKAKRELDSSDEYSNH